MKRCSYCGKEYPDDATECAIDATPFVEVQPESDEPRKHIRFGIFSEYEIPVSLTIVSYLFFIPAAWSFAAVIVFLVVFFLPGGDSGIFILGCVACGAIGMFWLLLSRGLRRCSRGWRTCALVLIWWGFIAIAYTVGRYFLTHTTPRHETPMFFGLEYGLAFIVQVWQYRVLTRPDVRDLFGV